MMGVHEGNGKASLASLPSLRPYPISSADIFVPDTILTMESGDFQTKTPIPDCLKQGLHDRP
jgi:hypothetical protein